jgi:hypothetical protein
MTLIAICTVIHIPSYARVARINLGLRMAACAHKDGIIRWVGMARGTYSRSTTMSCGEPGMVERSSGPRCSAMTCLASGWKACRHVIRTRRAFVDSRVTGIAVGGSPCKDISYVAVGAEHIDVGAR